MNEFTRSAGTVFQNATRAYVLFFLLVPVLLCVGFIVGPGAAVITACVIAFGKANELQETKRKSIALGITIGLASFGAFLFAAILYFMVSEISAQFNLDLSVKDLFLNADRTDAQSGLIPTSSARSLRAAATSGAQGDATFFGVLLLTEYISLTMMAFMGFFLALRTAVVRGAIVKAQDRLMARYPTTPLWLSSIAMSILLWIVMYHVNFTWFSSWRAYALALFAPIAGPFFLIFFTSTLLLLRIKILGSIFETVETEKTPQDVVVRRLDSGNLEQYADQRNLRAQFLNGRVATPTYTTRQKRQFRSASIRNAITKYQQLKTAFMSPKSEKLKLAIICLIGFGYLYFTGNLKLETSMPDRIFPQ
ncbi:MAG: hypothetical protein AAF429_10645 [Pseudomonadota bacterium]